MYRFIINVLVLGQLYSLSAFSKEKIILQDKIVFKVARSVFTVDDLKKQHLELQGLKCVYDDSLVAKVFVKEFKPSQFPNLEWKGKIRPKTVELYKELILFAKLLIYSESQEVNINSNLKKFFYLMAKRNKCDKIIYGKDGNFSDEFIRLIRFEVFARSRFLPTEKSRVASNSELIKASRAARELLKSINSQVGEEVYW